MAATRKARSGGVISKICMIGLVFGFAMLWPLMPAVRGADPDLQILSSDSGELIGPLVVPASDGVPCLECGFGPQLTVDGAPLLTTLGHDGGAAVSAAFSGLADGRHKAVAAYRTGEVPSEKRHTRLILVDTAPPVLEMAQPTGDRLVSSHRIFMVRVVDPGSGLPPTLDQMTASATLNGVPLSMRLFGDNGQHALVMDASQLSFPDTVPWRLRAKVADRAGNEGVLDRTFHGESETESIQAETIYCQGGEGPVPYERTGSGTVPFQFRQRLQPLAVSQETMAAELILHLPLILGKDVPDEVRKTITLECDHPNVRISRGEATHRRNLSFRIEQTRPVSPSESLTGLWLTYPQSVNFAFDYGCSDELPVLIETRMASQGRVSHTVPLVLFSEWTSAIRISQEGKALVCRVEARADGVIDADNSWFAVDGDSEWFVRADKGLYSAAVPVQEGPVDFKVQVGTAFGTWQTDGNTDGTVAEDPTRRLYEGQWLVRFDRPQIPSFRYDADLGSFVAEVADDGTPAEAMTVRVQADGREVACRFDAGSNRWISPPFPVPEGMETALCVAVDRADQRAQRTALWGTPPAEVPITPQVTGYQSSSSGQSRLSFSPEIETVSEHRLQRGKSYVQVCSSRFYPARPPTAEEIRQCERWVAAGGCVRIGCDASICGKPFGNGQWGRDCRWEWRDITPPAIEDVASSPAGVVTATIHDHGAPISEMVVTTSESDFSFDDRTGRFRTVADISELEHKTVRIWAADAARNHTSAYLELTVPLKPPEIELEVSDLSSDGHRIAFQGVPLSVLLTATAEDPSGIDHGRNRPAIDGIAVPVLSTMDVWGRPGDRILFGAQGLGEGPHLAEIRISDRVGMSASARTGFSISGSPVIRNFRYLAPPDPLAATPVFSARVRDPGNELSLANIAFWVDGLKVPADQLYYHSSSGYLAADGPMALGPGHHEARIEVFDDQGNTAEEHIAFSCASAGAVMAPDSSGPLRLSDIAIREIRPVDGDGLANPGETVRLYFQIENSRSLPVADLKAELLSLDPLLRVENPEIILGDLDAGDTIQSSAGFDIRIDEGVSDLTRTDPYRAPLRLHLIDDDGNRRSFAIELPIYQIRSQPEGRIRLTIDPSERVTTAAFVNISGTASATPSIPLVVTISVNGSDHTAEWNPSSGRYRARIPLAVGENGIAVSARSPEGGFAEAATRIVRETPYRPPRLIITMPGEGALIDGCRPFDVAGRLDPGSSSVDTLQLTYIPEDEPEFWDSIDLTIDGSAFSGTVPALSMGGVYELRVTLETRGGDAVTAIRIIQVSDCS